MLNPQQSICLDKAETQQLIEWIDEVWHSDQTYFDQARTIVRRLGAHYRSDGFTEVMFWAPEQSSKIIQTQRDLFLEVFTPVEAVDFRLPEQDILFQYDCIPMVQHGEFVLGVLSGMVPGNRDRSGSFYWLRARDNLNETIKTIRDVAPYSLPYGIYSPAELYDIESLQQTRADLDYFQDRDRLDTSSAIPRVKTPVNILQIHVGTATGSGTFEDLTQLYQRLSDKLANHEPLTAAEENFVGFDAVQLLPTEPTIEYRLGTPEHERNLFELDRCLIDFGPADPLTAELAGIPVQVTLRRPHTQNWGYDTPIIGASTTSPSLLASLRPDEVVDFIATLHNFSQGPIQVIYDLVYGHSDNQALELISATFFSGPNMYGQDINHQHPIVRAILLEMQRRKINTGVDGIRIDGGQDFRFFNPLSGKMEYDNAYLLAMSDVVQEIGGAQRLMFTIFEDGRPWPEEGWEEKSTYRELIDLRPEAFQWGPLIFAHNTPAIKGFWDRKWDRITQVMVMGDRWITGCGNHDTLRRGTQLPTENAINVGLGQTLPEVIKNAYDNPATQLWVYGFSPGLPMDFLNTLMGASWGFFRNTDYRYGVKVVAEEKGFLDWRVTEAQYEQPHTFRRLKQSGFSSLGLLKHYMGVLADTMTSTDYDLEQVVAVCQSEIAQQPDNQVLRHFLEDLDISHLRDFAMAFMEDMHEHCRVVHYQADLDPAKVHFNAQLRQYRRQNPWLLNRLTASDRFNHIHDPGRTLFLGLRSDATEGQPAQKRLALLTHMEGDPIMATLGDWLQLDLENWQVAIATPGLESLRPEQLNQFELAQGQGILLEESLPSPQGPG
ncbi:glucosylglycerol hydrolase [Lyngbya confervoides]|uniref:Alpha-amylase n=1 Tax=Lyngbya confervoides BDU141951 TaxID=1574623 RepID=A0ABD4T3S8_9CYAN|nr:glucosylglycerol hydrolase [Lyngbya confervoides]MCM1983138.1 alpha-amylase [Lyngbya confervoides BDU141951]